MPKNPIKKGYKDDTIIKNVKNKIWRLVALTPLLSSGNILKLADL